MTPVIQCYFDTDVEQLPAARVDEVVSFSSIVIQLWKEFKGLANHSYQESFEYYLLMDWLSLDCSHIIFIVLFNINYSWLNWREYEVKQHLVPQSWSLTCVSCLKWQEASDWEHCLFYLSCIWRQVKRCLKESLTNNNMNYPLRDIFQQLGKTQNCCQVTTPAVPLADSHLATFQHLRGICTINQINCSRLSRHGNKPPTVAGTISQLHSMICHPSPLSRSWSH